MPTCFRDVHIPVQPQYSEPLQESAYHYIAHIAWPHDSQEKERDRLVGALVASQFKVAGKHLPPTVPMMSKKNVSSTIYKALSRIYERRVPAMRMLVQHWVRAGLVEVPGLTPAQQERLRGLNATNALLDPDGDMFGQGRPFLPERNTDNIVRRIWRDSLPALAMVCALKLMPAPQWQRRSIVALLEDASWVPDAVWDARWLALLIEHTIAPPRLLVPRRVIVKSRSRVLPIRTRAWRELALPSQRVASAPKIGPAATPRTMNK